MFGGLRPPSPREKTRRAKRSEASLVAILAIAIAGACAVASCGTRPVRESLDGGDAGAARGPMPPSDDAVIAALRPFEAELRAQIDFRHPPSAETGLGADPWGIRKAPEGRWVGILRGRSELVLLDEELRTISRIATPRSPTGLDVSPNGEIVVVGELSPVVARYAIENGKLAKRSETRIAGVLGLRDVAITPGGVVWALDERGNELRGLVTPEGRAALGKTGSALPLRVPTCHGGAQVLATAHHVVALCVTEHEIRIWDTDASGAITNAAAPARAVHDGPIWSFAAREIDEAGRLVVAAGGVEDHPLDRREGFFGYVDSFVWIYDVANGHVTTLAETNVAEHGVVTPKAIAIEAAGADGITVFAGAYGSAKGARLEVKAAATGTTQAAVTELALVPGLRAATHAGTTKTAMAMPNPLFDAWVLWDGATTKIVPVDDPFPTKPTVETRLGEALFFTTLMAPENHSGGAHSRFTCETCHFEGYVDGRIHHTGREEIHAVTKPLVGLLGNRPHFTRALDPDLSTIAHAEFRVAGAGNAHAPFFTMDRTRAPWLAQLGNDPILGHADGYALRRALMRFLASFSHRPSSAIVGRKVFDATERRGATLFREKCATCHMPLLSADDPKTAIAFEEWEATIFAEDNPIVWARTGYEKTGVLPYVHPDGARTSSLRRLSKKWPYFTNGSAKSLDDVLARVRAHDGHFFHDGAPADARALDESERKALRTFLDLL